MTPIPSIALSSTMLLRSKQHAGSGAMSESTKSDNSEVRLNYEAFRKKLPDLLQTHRGKFALMHDREVVELYDTAGDAYKVGIKSYGEGSFSVQEVTDSPVDLGFFNHAISQRSV